MCAKDAAMCAKDAAMCAKDAAMCAKDAAMCAKVRQGRGRSAHTASVRPARGQHQAASSWKFS